MILNAKAGSPRIVASFGVAGPKASFAARIALVER